MTRRRFYAPRIAFAADSDRITLSDDEAQHARDVLRLSRDDEVFVFDGEGREYRCVIADIGARSMTLTVAEETEAAKPESPLDLTLAVRVVKNVDEAMEHIAKYGSHHTEAIVTSDYPKAMRFLREVDASAVLVNASTRLNDGYQFGLGAEIGISTSRIHARGPMGLEELTCFKFIVLGSGQVRE